jgi:Kef-type K+ transport system membrane component KefB
MTIEHLILQIAVILLATRFCGAFLRLLGQPEVIGEMIGGLVIGPSALGLMAHGAYFHWLFPAKGMPFLQLLSELGVMFFMFIVGLELDLTRVRGKGPSVVATGVASLLGPFAAGLVMAWLMLKHPALVGHVKSPAAFILMAALAMGMTAFPVLARIVNEQNLKDTEVGAYVITAGAVLDVSGWCLLAVVYDLAKVQLAGGGSVWSSIGLGVKTVVLAVAYIVVMMFFVRRFLWRFQAHFQVRGTISRDVLALTFFLLLVSSLVTTALGINPIFGAFMLGLVFPSNEQFVQHITSKLEDLTLLLLLPIFFATIGMHTNITQLHSAAVWKSWGYLIAALMLVKFICSSATAKITGASWSTAGLAGLLMNTHGVVELVVLSLAWQMGAISSTTLTVLVLAFLAITTISSILVRLVRLPMRRRELVGSLPSATEKGDAPKIHILAALSQSTTATALIRVSHALLAGEPGRVTALLLRQPAESTLVSEASLNSEADPINMALAEAKALNFELTALSPPSMRIARDICKVIEHQNVDWAVLGAHQGIVNPSALGGVVDYVLKHSQRHVAILINKRLAQIRRVLVPYLGEAQDAGAMLAAQRISKNANVEITILHVVKPKRVNAEQPLGVKELVDRFLPGTDGGNQIRMTVIETDTPVSAVSERSRDYDLMILGISPLWRLRQNLLGSNQSSVAVLSACSVLIVHAGEKKAAPTEAKTSQR